MKRLHERKINSVIIEGGTQTLNSFINDDCWDEARVFSAATEFDEGIQAPEIEGSVFSEQTIFDNQLTIYRNSNG